MSRHSIRSFLSHPRRYRTSVQDDEFIDHHRSAVAHVGRLTSIPGMHFSSHPGGMQGQHTYFLDAYASDTRTKHMLDSYHPADAEKIETAKEFLFSSAQHALKWHIRQTGSLTMHEWSDARSYLLEHFPPFFNRVGRGNRGRVADYYLSEAFVHAYATAIELGQPVPATKEVEAHVGKAWADASRSTISTEKHALPWWHRV